MLSLKGLMTFTQQVQQPGSLSILRGRPGWMVDAKAQEVLVKMMKKSMGVVEQTRSSRIGVEAGGTDRVRLINKIGRSSRWLI